VPSVVGTVLEFGDGSSPVLTTEGTVALGANVTVEATMRNGTKALIRAGSFTGVENLDSWTDSHKVRFAVSDDGKTLKMSVANGLMVIFR